MKKKLLAATAIAATMAMGASAAVTTNLFDQWTFTSAPLHKSEIKEKYMGNWDTNTFTTTTVPSAGLLRDATGGNSAGAYWGETATRNAVGGGLDNITVIVDFADWNHAERDVEFEFLGPNLGAGLMRVQLNSYAGAFSIDAEGNGTDWSDSANIFDTDDYTGAIAFRVAVTWDFLNNTMSYTVTGDGAGYTGGSSSAFSDTQSVAADLSGITGFQSMRVRGGTVGAGEYMDLDTVTVGVIEGVEEPPPSETTLVEQWAFDAPDTQTGTNGTIISTWTTNAPNSMASTGVLHYATSGTSDWKALPNVDTATIDKLILTVEVSDLYVAATEASRFLLLSANGATGHLETKYTSWSNGKFAPDILVGGTTILDANTDISFAATNLNSALTMVTTWDFENDTVSFVLSGPGAAGLGTTSWTADAGVDLSAAVGTINAIQLKTSTAFTSWLDLNTVTIETQVVSDPAPTSSAYEVWLSSYPGLGSETNKTDNPDGDAMNNLYEYGLGGNPEVADTGYEGTFQLVGSSMEYVHVQRNDDTNLVYTLEITDDLVNGTWTNAGYTVTGVNTNSGIADFDKVTNSIPTDVKAQQFIKLIIE